MRRIFLSLYIKTNYKGKVKFRMESLGKIFRDEDDQSIVGMKIKDRMPIKYKKIFSSSIQEIYVPGKQNDCIQGYFPHY